MTFILIFAAVCIVVFGVMAFIVNAKEKKELKEELQRAQNQTRYAEEVIKNYGEQQKENEELLERSTSGNSSDSADASVQLLHKLSEKGKKRNSK